jgi:TrmH family RNA methyltransferase
MLNKKVRMEITSVSNTKIKEIRALKTKKARDEQQRFLVEGHKCVEEGITFLPQNLLVLLIVKESWVQHAALAQKAEALGAEVFPVSRSVMEAIADAQTPQGVAAVFALPHNAVIKDARFLVALHDVQDPANVGAIIRTADAAGADGALLSEGCADVYSPKALRASMGSAFHIGVLRGDLLENMRWLQAEGFKILAAHLEGTEQYAFVPADKICLVIGNEANGISQEVLELCTQRIRIPIYGKAESLNAAVAAGILLYGIANYRR